MLETLGRAFSGSLIGMALLDLDGRWLEVNPALCRMLGRRGDELLGQPLIDVTHPDDVAMSIDGMRAMADRGEQLTFEKRYLHADGSVVHARVTNAVAYDDDGQPRAIFSQIEDVSEQRAAERRLRQSEQRFTRAFEDAGVAMALMSLDCQVLQANPALSLLLGRPRAQLLGVDVREFLHTDERDTAAERVAALVAGRSDSYRRETCLVRADGELVWVGIVASLVRDRGEPLYLVLQIEDISSKREAERMAQLRLAQQTAVAWLGQRALAGPDLASLFEAAVNVVAATLAATHAGLAVVDPGGRLRLATAVGWPNGLTVDADPKRGHAALTLAARAPIVVEDIDDEQRFTTDGLRARGLASGMSVVVLGEDDEPFGVLSMHSTERRAFTNDDIAFLTSVAHVLTGAIRHDAAARDLRHQSLHDPLTHLPNRALMLDRLRQGLARAQRDGSMLAVLFCDMDDFKYVNDSLGHEAGDLLLADLAPRLQGALRTTDTLARFGGDEFVVLCEGLHDTCEALALADRLLAACATPVDLGGTEFVPGASIGIALAPPGCDADPEGLLRDADVALYQAKSGGKGRHEVFDARMRVRTLERVSLIADLRRAISGGELELAFQPIVGLQLGEVVGVEALVRWRHPVRGLLLPSEFIGLAEDSGLIHDLGRWVLDEAVRHGARWRASGTPVLERARVGVNISWRQIARGTLVEDVRAALDRHGLEASALWFEVTETALMEDPGRSRITLRQLRELGAELALDDFGTGQSSLSVLRDFALDVLKLDRSFVSGRGEWEIVRAVCEMARSLDMRVVAEGIELPAQAEQARAMGAVYGQGWLYSPPLGLDGFEDAMLALSGALRRGQVGPTT